MFDEHSSALIDQARLLAADGREDQAAVDELAAMAKGHKRALRVAALGARQWGRHRESTLHNLTHRLLQAAVTGAAVEPVSADERGQLATIDAFCALPRSEQWRFLIEREPRLTDLETAALNGEFGGRHVMAAAPEERPKAASQMLKGMKRLDERVKPLVGPEADTSDVILGTHLAREFVRGHLHALGRRSGP